MNPKDLYDIGVAVAFFAGAIYAVFDLARWRREKPPEE